MTTLRRRDLLVAMGSGLAAGSLVRGSGARAASPPYELHELTVAGDRHVGTRFLLLVPRPARATMRLLVALHGLGETGDPVSGSRAWLGRYGLGTAYERLLAPPLQPVAPLGRHWRKERLDSLNEALARQPFAGIAVACPYTPNVYRAPDRERLLGAYADWLVDEVLPRARREAGTAADATHTSLDGCSLGGYVGIEVFLRKAEHFGAWGSVQGAFGAHRIARYAEALRDIVARLGARPIHLETSTGDPFREVNERLARELSRHGVPHELVVPPGPHDQPFLRDSGTIEMLRWHERLG